MKKFIFISALTMTAIYSCTPTLTSSRYASIEPWKEWEIEVKFNKDSSFTMIDRFGCNRFNYIGIWHYHQDSFLSFVVLNDTTKSEYIKSNDMYRFYDRQYQKQREVASKEYFPVITTDTVYVFEKNNMLRFRGLTFKRQKLFSNRNLSKERERIIERHYIDEMGRDLFIKIFGNGKGIKEARKNIMDCKINPIPNVELDKYKRK
jgi:hypothetical protein